MRNVIPNVFKRSTLGFMSFALALGTVAPVFTAPTASATTTAPLSADVTCVDEKAVLTVTARQTYLPGLPNNAQNWHPTLGLENVHYSTVFGNKSQHLTVGDVDYHVFNTDETEITAGVVSAQVTGSYSTKEPIYAWVPFLGTIQIGTYDKWHLYNSSLGPVNYSAKNCDETPPAVPTDLAWTAKDGSAQPTGGLTNVNKGTLNWTDTDEDTDYYKYYFWTDIAGHAQEGEANAWMASSFTNPEYFTGSSIWTNFDEKEGTFFFCVKAVDENGNESLCSDVYSVKYDKTAPVVAIVDYTFVANVVTPEVEATDENGITSYLWTPVGDAATNVDISEETAAEPEFTVNVDGTYTFNLTVTDNASNKTTVPFEFTYKKPVVVVPPVTTNNNSGNNTSAPFVQPAAIFGINDDEESTDSGLAALGSASSDESGEVAGATDNKDDKGCGIFLGICWYYWIPIVLAILAVVYAVRRRLQANNA